MLPAHGAMAEAPAWAAAVPHLPPCAGPVSSLRRHCRGLRRLALLALLAVAAAWSLPGTSEDMWAPTTPAALFWGRRYQPTVLATYRGHQVVLVKGTGRFIGALPRLKFRREPPPPVALDALSGAVDGTSRAMLGFPYTTRNDASVKVRFPRAGSAFGISVKGPAQTDADSLNKTSTSKDEPPCALTLEQIVGSAKASLRLNPTTGEWFTEIDGVVQDIGQLRLTAKSDLDWSADLEASYSPVLGLTPSLSYGATQDGLRARGRVDGAWEEHHSEFKIDYSYESENHPGKYSPVDLMHKTTLRLSQGKGRHSVQVNGVYDRKLPRIPVRGSLLISSKNGPLTFVGSADYDRFCLQARTVRFGEYGATLYRKKEGMEKPIKELEMKVGPFFGVLSSGPTKPRLRLGFSK